MIQWSGKVTTFTIRSRGTIPVAMLKCADELDAALHVKLFTLTSTSI